eukprot:g57143.t1
MGGMVSQVHSKVVPDANLVSVLQQSDNLRARAGLYQEGDDLLEHAAKVPRLERMAKRNWTRYSGHDIDLTRYAYRARYRARSCPYRVSL